MRESGKVEKPASRGAVQVVSGGVKRERESEARKAQEKS